MNGNMLTRKVSSQMVKMIRRAVLVEKRHLENGNTMQIIRSVVIATRVKTDASDDIVDKKPQSLQRIDLRHNSLTSMYRPR